MKITLKNFRCYENEVFDFGDNGLALLSGSSGAGKTSILLGFNFCLFGVGTKLVMYGKSSCNVNVLFNDIDITRTKRPNRLVVKMNSNVYEDDAAQSIINKRFGESFKTTGYISQNAKDSFILLSPIEKLAFLEKFAFQDINLVDVKKRCKELIHKRNAELTNIISKLEMANNMISEMVKPTPVTFPLKCSSKSREKYIKQEKILNKNTEILIKRQHKKIKILQEEFHSIQLLNANNKSSHENLNINNEKLQEYTTEKDNIKYIGDEEFLNYKNNLKHIISKREFISLEDRYKKDTNRLDEMKIDADIERNDNIDKIEKTLWVEYTEEECRENINDYKQIIKDLENIKDMNGKLKLYKAENTYKEEVQLKSLKTLLEDKKKTVDTLKLQQEIYKCPSCDTKLRIQDEELIIAPNSVYTYIHNIEHINKEIIDIKNNINKLEKYITTNNAKSTRYDEIKQNINDIETQYEEVPEIKEIKSDLEYMIDYYRSQKDNIKILKECKDNFKYNSSIISIEKDIKNQYTQLNNLRDKYDENNEFENIPEEEIRNIINTQTQYKDRIEKLKKYIYSLTLKTEKYEKEILESEDEHIKIYKKVCKEHDIKLMIQVETDELTKLEDKKIIHQKNVDQIEKYIEYIKNLDIYNSWVDKVGKLECDEKEHRKLYVASELLKQKILEAESISMINIISSINSHAQVYLDSFFPDDPISIKLVSFKETKKKKETQMKPQINLEIEYKGMEADINMLSGGEISRVILAYALALGEMLNSPIMLLDECTSSLDQESTCVVMDGIREHFNGKLVLIIAHQVVKGQFDTVIKI